jgi:hypothetical protein
MIMTHFEKLKAMSLEEMVECHDICPLEYGAEGKYCDDTDCQKCRKIWLESEVE